MKFHEFWLKMKREGRTPQGDVFSVVEGNRGEKLHILSDGNKNKHYYILKDKAEEYFDILSSEKLTPKVFRRRRSAYFHNIFLHVSQRTGA